MKKYLIIGIVILVVIVGGFYMRRSRPQYASISPLQSPLLGVTGSTVPDATDQMKEITVNAKQYSFEPGEIRVKKGDRVRLTLNNIDVAHGINIPEFGFSLMAPVGEQKTAEFTADRVGTFLMYCSVFCGSGHNGMRGMLIVE